MDLMSLKPTSEVVVVTLMHPVTFETLLKDDGKPMTITMHSPYSKEYKQAVHEQTDKRISRAQKGKSVTYTALDMESATLELMAKATKDWDITFDGKCPKYTVSKAMEIYQDIPWLRDQIEEAVTDTNSFIKG